MSEQLHQDFLVIRKNLIIAKGKKNMCARDAKDRFADHR